MLYRPSRQLVFTLLALLAAPTLLLWRVVFLGDVFLPAALLRDLLPWRDAAHTVPWNPLMWDGMAEFYPWRLLYARTLHAGFLPLWNPHQFCGTPFLADGQSAVLYPPNLLFVVLPVARAFGVSVWLHLVLTGMFLYGFLRSPAVGVGRGAAVAGAVVWQMGTWQVGWLALPTFLCVSAWLPLSLWLTWRLVARPSAGRAAAAGAALGMSVLAGHLQIALYGFLLTGAYALFLLARGARSSASPLHKAALTPSPSPAGGRGEQEGASQEASDALSDPRPLRPSGSASAGEGGTKRGTSAGPGEGFFLAPQNWGGGASALSSNSGGRATVRTLAFFLLALVIMAGICAPQMLPTLELSRVSHRAGIVPTLANYAAYVRLALPWPNLVTLYLPGVFGSPTDGTFWGIGTNGGPAAYVENGCSVGVLALLLAVAGVVAGWRASAAVRFFSIAAMVALLMALGTPLDALLYFGVPGFAASGSPGRILGVWTLCVAVLAAAGVDRLPALTRAQWTKALAVFTLGFAASAAYAAWWIGANAPPGILAAGLVSVPNWWRVPAAILLGAAAVAALHARGTWSARQLQGALALLVLAELLATNGGYNRTARPQDVYPITPLVAFLQSHAGDGRIIPINRTWSLTQPPQAVLPPNSAIVYNLRDLQGYDSLLTGRYFAWAAGIDSGSPAPAENGNIVFTYGLGTVQARQAGARWIVSGEALPPQAGLRAAYAGPDGFVYEDTQARPMVRMADTAQPITAVSAAPTRQTLTVPVAAGGAVTLAEQWYPGWWARQAGGEWTRAGHADSVFQSIAVTPSGASSTTVEVRYRPASLQVGLYALCVTVAALCGLAGYRAALRRGPTAPILGSRSKRD